MKDDARGDRGVGGGGDDDTGCAGAVSCCSHVTKSREVKKLLTMAVHCSMAGWVYLGEE